MSYILLRRTVVANVAPATGYTVQGEFWDTQARRRYVSEPVQATTNTGNNAPFELTVGAFVPGASFCINGTQRQVRYAGSGQISTHDVPNAPACASALADLVLTTTGLDTVYDQSAQIRATWAGAAGTVTVRCVLLAAGVEGVAPYYNEQYIPYSTSTALFIGGNAQAPGGFDTRAPTVRRLQLYNPVAGLGPGRYRVDVTEDATGYTLSEEITIVARRPADASTQYPEPVMLLRTGYTGSASFAVLTDGPLRLVLKLRPAGAASGVAGIYVEPLADERLVRLVITPSSDTRVRIQAWIYSQTTGQVTYGERFLDTATLPYIGINYGEALPAITYVLPAGTPLPPPTGITAVVSNGQGGVHTLLYAYKQRLTLDNLIFFQPPKPTGTGGLLIEVHSAADHDPAANDPLTYRVYDAAQNLLQFNQTGRFDALPPGRYMWEVTNGTVTINGPFQLVAEYGLKYQLAFDDLGNHAPCRLELWVKNYTGQPVPLSSQAITGQGDGPGPVSIAVEGLTGGENQNDLPPVVGTSMTMRLRTAPGLLQDLLLSDQNCRADFYYNNGLRFTGFVEVGVYDEALLAGPVEVELMATCGIGGLKDVDFLGHEGQELRGRRPILHTMLHCLSRTGITAPVYIHTNRAALEMTTEEAMELAGYTNRLAYRDEEKPWDMNTVLDAICQALGGTLVQRYGTWWILSPLEAGADAPGRHYTPAASAGGVVVQPSPTGRILPARLAERALARPPYPRVVWHWLDDDQTRSRRAGWSYFTGAADAGFTENAFRQGTYFNNADIWDASGTVLRAEAGWLPGPGGFPISLVEAGTDSKDLAARWVQASAVSDNRYLEAELAPVEAGREGLAMQISAEGKFLGRGGQRAQLWVEIVAHRVGYGPVSMGAVLSFASVAGVSAGFSTATASVPVGLLAGAIDGRVRVHAFTVFPLARARDNNDPDVAFVLKSVAIQVLPQAAKWDGKTAAISTGSGGSVRPGSPLEVVHVDAPANAGLFRGVAHAFRNTVTYGPLDPTTQWARADDLLPSPLLAANVLDVLALRANPSQLLRGTLRVLGGPPEFGDSVDAPYNVPGRRWFVASRVWDVRPARAAVSLIEIGPGEFLTPPANFLPNNVRLLDGLLGGRRKVRTTDRGVRVIQP